MKHLMFVSLVCAGMLVAMLPQAKADQWNQKTVVMFNQPVEIPGQVLQPGTYVFKLASSLGDRNIVQIFNKRQTHLYATILAIPDYHLRPRSHTVIKFEERAEGSPEALRAWFYPGDSYGHEFVYPKTKAIELAKANNMPVASMPNEMAANTTQPATTLQESSVTAMKNAPLKAEQPSGEETEAAATFPPAPAQSSNTARSLPTTASSVPLLGLIGLLSLGGAGVFQYVSGRQEQ